METLQQKIKRVVELTGMTYKQLAQKTGVSVENLYKWKKSSNPRNFHEHDKFNKGLDAILENFPKSKLEEFDPKYHKKEKAENSKALKVSIFLHEQGLAEAYGDDKAIPGSIISIKGQPALIAYRNESAIIGEVDGLIDVRGDSMAPMYRSGCWIAITKLKFFKLLVSGDCYYIIDNNNCGVLRRIKMVEGSNDIELISENEEKYPGFIRNFEEIQAIFKVEAIVIKP